MNIELNKRRTFAIISHPDAGKTTLTEKILLAGGAIHLAGEVRAKGNRRRTRSDWMEMEKRRGISINTSVMMFCWNDMIYNLLDTPGHEDFSEDTYRTLTAVDSVIMVLDAAKGIELQTLKLFEICRLRDIPVITFVNKIDRETKDLFLLCDEIADKLALEVAPIMWPIGIGKELCGCYDMRKNVIYPFSNHKITEIPKDVEMVRELMPIFEKEKYLLGHMTPVIFGSALKNFGVFSLLEVLKDIAPSPLSKKAQERTVYPTEKSVTGFVFKVQANMDSKHRDRVAFVRLCSGKFVKGQKLFITRTEKTINVQNPVIFFAAERVTLEHAYAGDIIGIMGHGLRVGDTLTTGEKLNFKGIASFSPEILRRIILKDPMKSKALEKGLIHLAEEGVVQVFRLDADNSRIIGVVGNLQLDVFVERLLKEYTVCVLLENCSYEFVVWIVGDTGSINHFKQNNKNILAYDRDGMPVILIRNAWDLNYLQKNNPKIQFFRSRNDI